MKVLSPLTGTCNVELVANVPTSFIKDDYKYFLGIDVNDVFNNLDYIQIYRCLDTDYKFYYPLNLSGKSKFYEILQNFDWYYMDWKWEHELVSNLVKSPVKLLEIGSGKGTFIEKLQNLGASATGLELNELMVNACKSKGINVHNQTIQEHSKDIGEVYDVVCSFQVMEHISDIYEVIEASLKVLKKGGLFIISVPNNNSFIKHEKRFLLNYPPHHMNLWTPESLTSLSKVFKISLNEILFEPLQPYHFEWYLKILEGRLINFKLINFFYIKFRIRNLLKIYIKRFNNSIEGHTVLAVFTKE